MNARDDLCFEVDCKKSKKDRSSYNRSISIEGKADADVENAVCLLTNGRMQVRLDNLLKMNMSGSSRDDEPEASVLEMLRKHFTRDGVFKFTDMIKERRRKKQVTELMTVKKC